MWWMLSFLCLFSLTCTCKVLSQSPREPPRTSPLLMGFSHRRKRTACTPLPPRTPSCQKPWSHPQWRLPKPSRNTDSLFTTCLKTASRPAPPLTHEIDALIEKKCLSRFNFSLHCQKKKKKSQMLISWWMKARLLVEAAFRNARLSFLLIHLDLHAHTRIHALRPTPSSNREVKPSTIPSAPCPQWWCSPLG